LEKSINLSIGEESDVTSEDEDDDNNVERQISENAQVSIQSTKSTRNLSGSFLTFLGDFLDM
jgi:hypothetical protein